MEHPYLFLVKLFEVIGLGGFAHHYPHVIYSWVVMAILIVAGALAAKSVTLVPGKGQNFFEILVGGIEDGGRDVDRGAVYPAGHGDPVGNGPYSVGFTLHVNPISPRFTQVQG